MKKTLATALAIFFALSTIQATAQGAPFSPAQIDNLLAPVALYPDPLLAQVLTAATYVDQVEIAARELRHHNDPRMIDAQPWDVSVKSVAHYPRVLFMMADKPDWTAAVGQAYVSQSNEVMAGVQRLRVMARNQGNLVSNPQQEVIVNGGYIAIDPIQPRYLFVPTYDPGVVFFRRGLGFVAFGAAFAIGAWLVYDFNWGHGVFYHGWGGEHIGWNGGWVGRSRGFVAVNNTVYVNNNYRNVVVNREVIHRNVNYGNLNSFNSVHHEATYGHGAAVAARPAPAAHVAGHGAPPPHQAPQHAAPAAHTAPPAGHGAAPGGQHAPAGKPAAQPAGHAKPAPKPAAKPQPGHPEHEKK
jgi:hypothetical protein